MQQNLQVCDNVHSHVSPLSGQNLLMSAPGRIITVICSMLGHSRELGFARGSAGYVE